MTPLTMQECEGGITNVRLQEPDFDTLIEEQLMRKLRRSPRGFICNFAIHSILFARKGARQPTKSQERSKKGNITLRSARMIPRILHEFDTRYSGMRLETTLVCSDAH